MYRLQLGACAELTGRNEKPQVPRGPYGINRIV